MKSSKACNSSAHKSEIFLIAKTDAAGHLSYEAGYAWKKAGEITTREAWSRHLSK